MYKYHIKQKLVIVAAFFVGIIIAIYIKVSGSNNVYISLEEKKEIENKIELTRKEIKSLNKIKENLNLEINKYKDVLDNENKTIEDLMIEDIEKLKVKSGYSNVKGDGIYLEIMDSEYELDEGQNPNDLVVHDIDILRIVNDLKASGAKYISINGDRILENSKIKCSGATITVNETTYGQPFIIKAIGSTKDLLSYINSPDSYTSILKDGYGINIKVEEKNNMVINSYEKSK